MAHAAATSGQTRRGGPHHFWATETAYEADPGIAKTTQMQSTAHLPSFFRAALLLTIVCGVNATATVAQQTAGARSGIHPEQYEALAEDDLKLHVGPFYDVEQPTSEAYDYVTEDDIKVNALPLHLATETRVRPQQATIQIATAEGEDPAALAAPAEFEGARTVSDASPAGPKRGPSAYDVPASGTVDTFRSRRAAARPVNQDAGPARDTLSNKMPTPAPVGPQRAAASTPASKAAITDPAADAAAAAAVAHRERLCDTKGKPQ